jgi:tRNA-specific 2-thiouridylase
MTPTSRPTRIAVAMSGGVDSAVAALLLARAGHEVFGVTLKLWCYGDGPSGERSCCSLSAIEDARRSCEIAGIRHYVLDFEERFTEAVIDRFVAEYTSGRTPNPCVLCNQHVKIGTLLDKVRAIGADELATGHYARLDRTGAEPRLRRAIDLEKDQSYMLWSVPRAVLAGTRMPLGEHRKADVRALAREAGLPVAEKRESQDICFVPDGDYAGFLATRIGADAPAFQPGQMLDLSGNRIGTHRGLAHYTVGQRRGLGVSSEGPLYVVGLDPETNTLTVGPRAALLAEGLEAGSVNWIASPHPPSSGRATAKIRYRHAGAPATLRTTDSGTIVARFAEPQPAVTPGQSVVFYEGDVVLGGGVISRSLVLSN